MPQLNRGFTLTWLGHSSFRLRTRGAKTVLIDPWVEGNPACPRDAKTFDAIDVMTISHGHGDHMSDAITLAKKFKPAILCNYEIHLFLSKKGVSGTAPMNKGGTQEAAGLRFTMVNATHSSGIEDGGQVVYGGEPCGYVITLEDGMRIYHAGDTGPMADMTVIGELYKPEVALLPIGDLFTMGPREEAWAAKPREAAWAAKAVQAKYVVPMHHSTFPALTGTPEMLRDELKKLDASCEVVALRPGESLS
jgi:L-ascorbate metabolism protein UlaG (beta-lactamase superfamily)